MDPSCQSPHSRWKIKSSRVSPEVPRSPRHSQVLCRTQSISMLKCLGSRSELRAPLACLSSASMWFNSLLAAVYHGHSLCHVRIQFSEWYALRNIGPHFHQSSVCNLKVMDNKSRIGPRIFFMFARCDWGALFEKRKKKGNIFIEEIPFSFFFLVERFH